MQHIEIHNTLEDLISKLMEEKHKLSKQELNSVKSLESVILTSCIQTLVAPLLTLKASPKFCIFCFYNILSELRKALSRYLIVETETEIDTESSRKLITEVMDEINQICISIKAQIPIIGEGHHPINNTAFEQINKPG